MKIENERYWNEGPMVVRGCTKVSPGCDNCWSLGMTRQYQKGAGFVDGNDWTGKVEFHLEALKKACKGAPKVISIWNDLFHEAVTDDQIDDAMAMISECDRHTFLVLTKRPERMAEVMPQYAPWPNLWLGVTAENQEQADKRIPILLSIPAAHRFVSVEPMLGPIDIKPYLPVPNLNDGTAYGVFADYLVRTLPEAGFLRKGLNLVILGGETGPHARPCRPLWVRSIRDQCQSACVSFFFKFWGDGWRRSAHIANEYIPMGRLLDGREHNDLPWVTR